MIEVNLRDIEASFRERYTNPKDEYLLPSYVLGYSAGLLPQTPNLAIPGHDEHVIIAAHNGRIAAEINKINKAALERSVGKKPKKETTPTVIFSLADDFSDSPGF